MAAEDPSLYGPGQATTPTPTGPMDFGAPAAPGSQVQYDANGYPLPTKEQIAAFHGAYDVTQNGKHNAGHDKYGYTDAGSYSDGSVAYDPSLAAPKPASENPYPPDPAGTRGPHGEWLAQQMALQRNADAKQAWQKSHESAKKPAESASSAATPFASSGVDLTKDGKGESYADSIIGHFSESGVPTVSNESKATLDQFRASQPQDMSPYYDYASKLTSAKIDNAMSARGSYGSSNATGQIGAAEMALRAQQAKDTAQYGLDRYAAEGNLAGSADATDARASALNFEWTKGLSDIAFKSQNAGEARNQDLFDNNFKVANAKAGNYTTAATGAIEGVGAATDAANNVAQGNAADSVSNANADANTAASHTSAIMDAANQAGTNYYNYKAGEDANKPKAN